MTDNPFDLYDRAKQKPRTKKSSSSMIDYVPPQYTDNEQQPLATLQKKKTSLHFPIFFILCFFVLIARVFFLQIIQSSNYRERAEGNRTKIEITKAVRGIVYDADGKQLVKNIPNFTLTLNGILFRQYHNDDRETILPQIAGMAMITKEEVQQKIDDSLKSGQNVILRNHIPYAEALTMMTSLNNIIGVTVEGRYAREYLHDPALSHILGYTGKISEPEYESLPKEEYQITDDIGKIGIEQSFERILHGHDGIRTIEVDAQGREKSILATTNPIAGNNIHLTVSDDLQQYLYESLDAFIKEKKLPGGAAAVALDPRNGDILALVSFPGFDNNAFIDGISQDAFKVLLENPQQPLFHRAIAGEYPAGSTFKPIVAAAALEEKIIDEHTTFQSTGGIHVNQFFFPDWKAGGHGTTDIFKALAESVNTFFYRIGGGDNATTTGLGVDRIIAYAKKFGLGTPTDIDLPSEADGFLPTPAWKEEFKNESWYIGDTYHLAIGQGDILVTPLQVAYYTSIIANRGFAYRPHVLDHITNANGETVETTTPIRQTENIVSTKNINIVATGLREAVLHGSAQRLKTLPVTAAGKTGTAQFGSDGKTHSWFTVFAPYENPEIVLTVLVEEGGEGNDASLPIAQAALARYFAPLLDLSLNTLLKRNGSISR